MRRSGQGRGNRRDRNLVIAVAVSFCLMLAAFLASGVIGELQSRRIEREAHAIDRNALMSSEALGQIRTSLRELLFTMGTLDLTDEHAPNVTAKVRRELTLSRRELARGWEHYASVPFYPGERALARELEADVRAVGDAVDEILERMDDAQTGAELRASSESVLASIERADLDVARLASLNQREAREASQRIATDTRSRGLVAEVIGFLCAIAAAYFGFRVLVRYVSWSKERSAELEQFAGRVAHDIRSPLMSVTLALEIAQRNKELDAGTRRLLERMARTMQHIRVLVDGLLVFATAGGQRVSEWPESKTSVREVLDSVIEDATLEAEKKAMELEYESPDPFLAVACGPGVLISIMTNLISNAIKFTADSSLRKVMVRASRVGQGVLIEVSDTGPGISKELRQKVFEPHVRGKTKSSGYGLGLATVRKLAEAHGGEVGVEARLEGGSRFWVYLPLWSEPPRGPIRAIAHVFERTHGA